MNDLYTAVDSLRAALIREKADQGEYAKLVCQSLGGLKPLVQPKYLMLKITNRCNSACAYCLHSVRGTENKTDVPAQVVKGLIAQCARLGVTTVTMTGGEPLLRDDIEEFIRSLLDVKIVPVLLTNGLLLPQRWRTLGEAGLKCLILSIDSLNPKVFRLHRGIELEKALAGLEAAQRMQSVYPRVKLYVTAVLTRHNLAEMPEFIRRLSAKGVWTQLSPYHNHHSGPDIFSIQDRQLLQEVVSEVLALKDHGMLVANTSSYIRHIADFTDVNRLPANFQCLAGYLSMFVDAHMNIHPCWSASVAPVGNVARDDLAAVWFGSSYAAAREQMLNCRCDGCWYLCTGELSTAFREEASHC